MTDFTACFNKLIAPSQEGGYVDNRDDPGGATRYGVTERAARANGYTGDMRELPVTFAQMVYQKDYWVPGKADRVPDLIRYDYFSFYVNAPPRAVITALQQAAGATPDGVLGEETFSKCAAMDPQRLIGRFSSARLLYYTSCHDWPAFGRGWTIRECNNRLAA